MSLIWKTTYDSDSSSSSVDRWGGCKCIDPCPHGTEGPQTELDVQPYIMTRHAYLLSGRNIIALRATQSRNLLNCTEKFDQPWENTVKAFCLQYPTTIGPILHPILTIDQLKQQYGQTTPFRWSCASPTVLALLPTLEDGRWDNPIDTSVPPGSPPGQVGHQIIIDLPHQMYTHILIFHKGIHKESTTARSNFFFTGLTPPPDNRPILSASVASYPVGETGFQGEDKKLSPCDMACQILAIDKRLEASGFVRDDQKVTTKMTFRITSNTVAGTACSFTELYDIRFVVKPKVETNRPKSQPNATGVGKITEPNVKYIGPDTPFNDFVPVPAGSPVLPPWKGPTDPFVTPSWMLNWDFSELQSVSPTFLLDYSFDNSTANPVDNSQWKQVASERAGVTALIHANHAGGEIPGTHPSDVRVAWDTFGIGAPGYGVFPVQLWTEKWQADVTQSPVLQFRLMHKTGIDMSYSLTFFDKRGIYKVGPTTGDPNHVPTTPVGDGTWSVSPTQVTVLCMTGVGYLPTEFQYLKLFFDQTNSALEQQIIFDRVYTPYKHLIEPNFRTADNDFTWFDPASLGPVTPVVGEGIYYPMVPLSPASGHSLNWKLPWSNGNYYYKLVREMSPIDADNDDSVYLIGGQTRLAWAASENRLPTTDLVTPSVNYNFLPSTYVIRNSDWRTSPFEPVFRQTDGQSGLYGWISLKPRPL